MAARFVLAAALLFPATALAQTESPPPQRAPLSDQARVAIMTEGIAALEKKDWQVCREKVLRAWESQKGLQTAAILGLCEEGLGLNAEAAEHLDYFRKNDDQKNAERTKTVEEAWYRVKPKVAILDVSTNAPEAEVRINGRAIGRAPQTLYMTPGSLVVELTAKGFKDTKRTMTMDPGSKQAMQIAMEPQAVEERSIVAPVALGVSAAVVLGAGIGMLVAGLQQKGDVDPTCADQTCVDEQQSDLDTASGLTIGGGIAIGIGAALGVGSVLSWVLPGSSESDTKPTQAATIRLQPSFGPTTGLSAIVTF